MQEKILFIEGKNKSSPSFVPGLREKGYQVQICSTGKAALVSLEESSHDLMIVDASTLRSNGKRISRTLHEAADDIPIILIANPDFSVPELPDINVILKLPFTIRKLFNRVVTLLPGEGKKVINAGPISIDTERQIVRSGQQETKLTPRLMKLLKILRLLV